MFLSLLFLFFFCSCSLCIFWMAHLGYLYCFRTSSRCFNSSFSSWELEHTALALCVKVLITLYLQARLWWLTILSLFFCGELYDWVHRVYVLQELISLVLFQNDKGVTHKHFPPSGGFTAVVRALSSKTSIYQLVTIGLTGDPIAAPWFCS